jgi:membrane protein implicated in regulation of membrane protease activity
MHIMLLFMLIPIAAIPVFFFLPLDMSIPIYLCCLLLAGLMFWLMGRTMRQHAVTGAEGLIGRDAEVIPRVNSGNGALYLVRVEGELWSARSRDALKPGETVVIVGVEKNRLTVKRKDTDSTGRKPD